ncbi:hypothetical protein BDB00DRAFT_874901 [Zychaea mexicana]|uniref:uncharacterized protein n=1 Tax=Zychaea mexicana TaxID=64656 RepID=UPI0022FE227A|nr:uncharacterized protein BDB00DRAFT_874901 [Zychaea mexicana]KAI9490900.1 hypothetical protein BDB00DRAFT_874901 [Zychaea mexicana]
MAAQISELTDQALEYNRMQGKQQTTKQISTTTASARLAAAAATAASTKKLPTPSPSSYTFAPRWMAKASPESRPSSPTSTMTDENFPSLSALGDDDDAKKKRSVWNDPTTVKQKVISPGSGGVPSSDGTDDPFAGMNTLVDYQQEIERLKALVPKVENKKRASTGSTPRPKSTGSDLKQRLLWNDLRSAAAAAAAAAAGRSGSSVKSHVSPTTRPMVADMLLSSMSSSNSSSVASDDDTKSDHSSQFVTDESQPSDDKVDDDDDDDDEPMESVSTSSSSSSTSSAKSVITEEEKARFLEFMRSWTGGWQGWDKNSINNAAGIIRRDGSLWTGETRRRSWNEAIDNRRADALNIIVPSATTPKSARYMNESFIQSEPSTPLGNSMYEPFWSEHAVVTATTPSKQHEQVFQRHRHHHPHQHQHPHQQQQQHPSSYHHSQQPQPQPQHNLRYGQQPPNNHYDSLQIGAIGDRNSVRGLPRMGGGGAPFGVFVM